MNFYCLCVRRICPGLYFHHGLVTIRNPEQCPSVVSLLAESYNPHVRYGAAMALGIACAGTGLKVSFLFVFWRLSCYFLCRFRIEYHISCLISDTW